MSGPPFSDSKVSQYSEVWETSPLCDAELTSLADDPFVELDQQEAAIASPLAPPVALPRSGDSC
jgi:hypothetical protein